MGNNVNRKTMALCFEVHGDYITEFARNLYRESKDPKKGVRFLMRALHGFPADLAAMVVMGKKKLVGVNEVVVEDDDVDVVPYGFIKAIEKSDVCKIECGWIAPNGDIYGHTSYNSRDDHAVLARRICERFYPNSKNEEFTLEDNGYMKLCPSQATIYASGDCVTMEQKHTLAAFCISHNRRITLGNYDHTFYSGNDIRNMDLLQFKRHLGVIL